MTDRELLEMAAKAAGISGGWGERIDYHNGAVDLSDMWILDQEEFYPWNPLEEDGDALKLAVQLGISLTPYPIYSETERHSVIAKQRRSADKMRQDNPTEVAEIYGNDPCAATRRAIVRAAAEIGKNC